MNEEKALKDLQPIYENIKRTREIANELKDIKILSSSQRHLELTYHIENKIVPTISLEEWNEAEGLKLLPLALERNFLTEEEKENFDEEIQLFKDFKNGKEISPHDKRKLEVTLNECKKYYLLKK